MDALPVPALFRDPFAPADVCGVMSRANSTCLLAPHTDGHHAGPLPDLGITAHVPFGDEDAITCQP